MNSQQTAGVVHRCNYNNNCYTYNNNLTINWMWIFWFLFISHATLLYRLSSANSLVAIWRSKIAMVSGSNFNYTAWVVPNRTSSDLTPAKGELLDPFRHCANHCMTICFHEKPNKYSHTATISVNIQNMTWGYVYSFTPNSFWYWVKELRTCDYVSDLNKLWENS